ncbi:MAG TPA: DUF6049 family protein, partial [Humibacter sp.]|nr:DUF6049 family protein [Humibacter sp.]
RMGIGRGALVAACVAVMLGALAPAPATASTEAAVAAADTASATVSMYAGNAGTETAGESVTVTISVDNTSGASIAPGTATVSITEEPLTTRDALDDWTKHSGDEPATRVISTTATIGVTAGTSSRVATVTIPASAVALSGDAAVYGLKTTVKQASGDVGTAYSSLAYSAATDSAQVGLAVAMPITVPPVSTGLIPSDDLATYTASDGLLTKELTLARNHPSIAIGIDPMIIASIRVLGSSAPQSARTWLQDLELLENDSFPLQYGDADVASELQSGITPLLTPTSFGYALDPKNFPTPITVGETPEPTPTPTTNPFITPTPTPTAAPTNVPTIEQLLSWPYTFSGIAWPADKSLRSADLQTLSTQGYQSTIVSGSNTNASSLSTTPNAPLAVKGGTALVTDQGISTALRKVVAATTVDEQNAALASVSSQLAVVSEAGSPGTIVLAGLDRNWPSNANTTSDALDAVYSLPWAHASSLREALTAPITSGLALTDATQDAIRTASVTALTSSAGDLDAFSTVLADPTLLTGQTRNELLSLLGVGWQQTDENWASAVTGFTGHAASTVASVKINPTGKITVASAQSLIPVTVTNGFDLPVNIVLRATPSNGRLDVDSDTAKTIPANSSAKVLVPVKAKLGNGSVKLGLQLYSPTGITIGGGTTAAIEVHADWEGLGALILGIAVVLFFGFGLVRSILRRRSARRRGSEPNTDDADDAASGADADAAGTDTAETDPASDEQSDSEHAATEPADGDESRNG